MTEPQAEVQATASLSPVSPAPVHTAAPRVVPALQDTVDTLDAMVADAVAQDVVDDDSLDGVYADLVAPEAAPQPQPDNTDDYAKTFDSPVDPQEAGEQEPPQHVQSSSSVPPESSCLPSEFMPSVTHDASDPLLSSTAPTQQQQQQSQQQPQPPSDPEAESRDSSLDIQKLVADLTAQPAETGPEPPAAESSAVLPSSSSLPPRPPQPQTGSPSYAAPNDPSAAVVTSSVVASTSEQPSSGFFPGAVPAEPASSALASPTTGMEPAPAAAFLNVQPHAPQPVPEQSKDGEPEAADYQRQWEQFTADERQYMSDAKWDRFPEGSRIFIGNLSSDKVSKRDVFDVFHKYGRLAQISLKSAYGFVQYHAVEEGRQAMEHLQGIEIKGRRIHLEVSRVQEKAKKDRGRSPSDRPRGRRGDKHHQGRDDYRPNRNHSPRRGGDYHSRDDSFGRSRGYETARGGRGRSRSPEYGRKDRDSYRRRSPSPYGRARNEVDLNLPSRYGADVPDVQIILQPEVSRDFATWVEAAFKAKGLKTEVMYLHPRFPKSQVVQRLAAEGVYGVVDLDLRSQSLSRIPVQAFDRSGGGNKVRFDQYLDLEPSTAAEVIVRAKSTMAAAYGQSYSAGYSNPYGAHPPQPPLGPGYPGAYPPQQQQHQPPQQPPQQQPMPSAADLANLMGQVDNATLQRILSSMQGAALQAPAMPAGYGVGPPPAGSQVDIQAILGSLGGAPPPAPPPPQQQQPQQHQQHQQHGHPHQGQFGPAYGSQVNGGGANANPDAAAQVQNIMAQLARYRQ
ncbi:hypothetical protein CP532_3925 [Ophiocordyceps camponoti-leonardi (nom. inval.)]|nr:hypothetical protein CP532_3925 [Ophiocordyceps camponoti-leonardi (nom. inval.)]